MKIGIRLVALLFFVSTVFSITSCEKEEKILNEKPVISDFLIENEVAFKGEVIQVSSTVSDNDNDDLHFQWSINSGAIKGPDNENSVLIELPESEEVIIDLEVDDGIDKVSKSYTYAINTPEFYDLFNKANKPWGIGSIEYSFSKGVVHIKRKFNSKKSTGYLEQVFEGNSVFEFTGLKTNIGHNRKLKYDDYFSIFLKFNELEDIGDGIQIIGLYTFFHPGDIDGASKNWSVKMLLYDHGADAYTTRYLKIGNSKALLDEVINLSGEKREFKVEINADHILSIYTSDFLLIETNELNQMINNEGFLFTKKLNRFHYYIYNACELFIDDVFLY